MYLRICMYICISVCVYVYDCASTWALDEPIAIAIRPRSFPVARLQPQHLSLSWFVRLNKKHFGFVPLRLSQGRHPLVSMGQFFDSKWFLCCVPPLSPLTNTSPVREGGHSSSIALHDTCSLQPPKPFPYPLTNLDTDKLIAREGGMEDCDAAIFLQGSFA